MDPWFFLPPWPIHASGLLWFAVVLIVAAVAGEAVARWLRLPRLVGYVAAGVVSGPHLTGLLDPRTLSDLRMLLDLAIGLVLFELGQRVNLHWLRRNPGLLATSLLESAAAFLAVFGVLHALGSRPLIAALAGAIAMATSPLVVMTITRESRAEGQVTERLLLLTTLNAIYAFVALALLLAGMHLEERSGWLVMVLHPLYLIGGSLGIALGAAGALLLLLRYLGRQEDAQVGAAIAMVVLVVTLAATLHISVVLSLLAFGALSRTLDRERRFASIRFGDVGLLATIIIFALTGAAIDLSVLPAVAGPALALVAARFFGKSAGVLALVPVTALSVKKSALLALALAPMSLMAVVMLQEASSVYPALSGEATAVVMASVAIMEVLGPLATHYALRWSGEAGARNS